MLFVMISMSFLSNSMLRGDPSIAVDPSMVAHACIRHPVPSPPIHALGFFLFFTDAFLIHAFIHSSLLRRIYLVSCIAVMYHIHVSHLSLIYASHSFITHAQHSVLVHASHSLIVHVSAS